MLDDALKFELLVWIQYPIEIDSIKSSLQFLIEAEFHDRAVNPRVTPTVAIANLPIFLQPAISNHETNGDRPSNGIVAEANGAKLLNG
jgi:potassium-dependent mechanosensitive channel